jgi:serine/threonine protein phosphatase PrpC
MADVQGLYIVTAVVLVTLTAWVILVLLRAPSAVDESSPATVRTAPKPGSALAKDDSTDEAAPMDLATKRRSRAAMAATVKNERPPELDIPPTPEPTHPYPLEGESPAGTIPRAASSPESAPRSGPPPEAQPEASAKEKRARTLLGVAPAVAAPVTAASQPKEKTEAPVVVLPPMRSRLDSHPEIQDSSPNATVIVMPQTPGALTPRPPVALVSAVGRSDPAPEKSPETHAIVERHHLFVFAEGSGKKVGMQLASAVAVEALTDAFDKDAQLIGIVDDPHLSPRANRVRRSVLVANRLLLQKARAAGYAGLSASLFAAYFSPSNEELILAHVGANRAYRFRAGELTRLTTPHGDRFVGALAKVEVEVVTQAVEPKDLYLFCSDGLARALGETELASILAADPSLELTTAHLIRALKDKDNTENLVAIAVHVDAAKAG